MSQQQFDKPLSHYVKYTFFQYIDMLDNDNNKGLYNLIISEVDKSLILAALEATAGNKVKAAKLLGMPRTTFYTKMKEYRLLNIDK